MEGRAGEGVGVNSTYFASYSPDPPFNSGSSKRIRDVLSSLLIEYIFLWSRD
jgi:hypothetical protein